MSNSRQNDLPVEKEGEGLPQECPWPPSTESLLQLSVRALSPYLDGLAGPEPDAAKRCNVCKNWKPWTFEFFGYSKRRRELRVICRPCALLFRDDSRAVKRQKSIAAAESLILSMKHARWQARVEWRRRHWVAGPIIRSGWLQSNIPIAGAEE